MELNSPLRRILPWAGLITVAVAGFAGLRSCGQPGAPTVSEGANPSAPPAQGEAGVSTPGKSGARKPGAAAASRPGANPGTGVNFAAVAKSVSEQNPGEDRDEALEMLLQGWVASAPGEAAAWVRELPGGDFRQDATSFLLLAWVSVDPRAAGAWLSASGLANAEAASTLASAWGQVDPGGATGWVAGLTDPAVRRTAEGAVAAAWALSDPTAAAAWVGALPLDERILAATQLVQVWGESDPAAAAAWIFRMSPDPSAVVAPVASLVSVWTDSDATGASRWINSLPEGEVRDGAATVFAVGAAEKNPMVALGWAMTLSGAEQRNQTVSDVCETWYDSAPDSFRSGIASALDAMDDPLMRKGVYEMLYERDPVFHDNLLKLIEPDDPPAPENTAAPESGAEAAPVN